MNKAIALVFILVLVVAGIGTASFFYIEGLKEKQEKKELLGYGKMNGRFSKSGFLVESSYTEEPCCKYFILKFSDESTIRILYEGNLKFPLGKEIRISFDKYSDVNNIYKLRGYEVIE